MLNAIGQDVRYAFRTIQKSKSYSAAVLLTLAIGIGANVAVFSVVYGVLFRPLPYAQPDRLVRVFNPNKETSGFMSGQLSPQDVDDLRRNNHSFESLSAYSYNPKTGGMVLLEGDPQQLETASVSGDFFTTMRGGAHIGRLLTPDDDVVGKDKQIVISYAFWKNQFGGDPGVVGRTLRFSDGPFTVVGVANEDMQFPGPEVKVWAPLSLIDDNDVPHRRQIRWLQVVARMKDGATLESAHADVNVVFKQLELEHADTNTGFGQGDVVSLRESIIGKVKPIVLAVAASVGLLLLIACVNLANLLLAKSISRAREFAVRAALGASRHRIVRQIMVESLVFALLGGVISLLVARWATSAIVAMSGDTIPRAADIRIDLPVVLFTLGLSIVAAVVFGLAPALRTSAGPLREQLNEGSAASGEGRKSKNLRELLVVGQMALAVALLIGAGLVLKSYVKLTNVDPGFNPDHVLSLHLSIPGEMFQGGPEQRLLFRRRLFDRLLQVPGVISVGGSKTMPLKGAGEPYGFDIDTSEGRKRVTLDSGALITTSGYFKTLRIPLIEGEFFNDKDDVEPRWVVVVSKGLADQLWPGQSAVGKQLHLEDQAVTVIGVAGNVRQQGLAKKAETAIYVPPAIFVRSSLNVFLRTQQDPKELIAPVRDAIWEVNHSLPISDIQPMPAFVYQTTAQPRFFASIVNSFATIALLLAAIGIYGVMAYAVRQRTREIGVRVALGAQRGHILTLILNSGVKLVLIGVVIGIVCALALGQYLASVLFEVSPRDLTIYIVMPLVLAFAGILATFIPAVQATRLDPLKAIRHE
jgi:putative ABC transport system permease protein